MRTPVTRPGSLLAVSLLLAASQAGAGDPQAAAQKSLLPRAVNFAKASLSLQDALAVLAKDTGNVVSDLRRDRANPTLAVPAGPTSFWPALDALARESGIGYSPYVAERGVALVDAPYRPVPTAYAGIFRVAVRRRAVVRDEETQSSRCELGLEVAWEPRFQPFYLDLKQFKVTFAPDAKNRVLMETLVARGPAHVAGRCAILLDDMQTKAPDRTCPKIDSVEGTLWAVGPNKMLTFDFAKLALVKPGQKPAPQTQTLEEVAVTLASIKRQGEALVARIQIENPKGGPAFESHQSWLDNNQLVLTHGKTRRAWVGVRSSDRFEGRRADVEYEFAEGPEQPLPATLDGWTLRYDTPGRIVEITAPFNFKDLALP